MRNIVYILKRDIRRILASWVAVIVILGICVLPSLYAWFNIAANIDPYEHTGNIKIAVACQDEGTVREPIGNVNVGKTIVKQLGKNKSLSWVVLDEDEAIESVKSGECYAAIVIPKQFSNELTSFLGGEIDTPVIDYYVNEKKNAIAPKVTDTGAQVIQQTIDTAFKGAVSEAILKTLGETAGQIDSDMSEDNNRIVSSIDEAISAIDSYEAAIASFHSTYKGSLSAAQNAKKLSKSVSKTLEDLNDIIDTNDKVIGSVKQDTEEAIKAVKEFQEEYPDILRPITDDLLASLQEVDTILNNTDASLNKAKGLVTSIEPATSQVSDMLVSLSAGLKSTDEALQSMKSALQATESLLLDARISINSLSSVEAVKELKEISEMDYEKMSEFMASPIKLDTEPLYHVENYGSGVAPFYTMLAIWVSGLIIIAIFYFEVDLEGEEERHITTSQAYIARAALFTFIALIQSTIICLGDIYLMGIQCVHPIAFLLAGLVSAIVFVNLIYALAITFRHIGMALAVLMVILQIPGSSGTYPVELTGKFFQFIYPLLPFSYGIGALRESIAGFYHNYYIIQLGMLLLFLLIALFLGLVVKPKITALNHTFDTRLSDTGFMTSERGVKAKENKLVEIALNFAYSNESYKEGFEERAEKFIRFHDALESKGFKYVVIAPVVLLAMVFIIPMKPLMITIWVVCIIIIAVFLIFVEHMYIVLQSTNDRKEVGSDEERNSDI